MQFTENETYANNQVEEENNLNGSLSNNDLASVDQAININMEDAL